MLKRYSKSLILFGSSLLAVACGGGSGGDSTTPPVITPPPTSGIEGTGIAVGPITGFGSVIVNGVRFDTANAVFTVDDDSGDESELEVGQIVRVTGSIDDNGIDGTAESVEYDDNVEGPIESIDIAAGQLVVLGQIVVATNSTIFDDSIPGSALTGLSVGDEVEVSGFVAADGTVQATRIELEFSDGEFEVRGTVSNLDSAGMTFMINMLLVDYGNAMLEGFSGGAPQNGDLVEAKGALGQGGELIATEVEREDDFFDGDDGDDVEVQGLITRFASASDFDVAGTPVSTSAATEFENGTADQLALDVLVEVEGEFDATGTLVADEIEFKNDEGSVRMSAFVETVDAAAGTLTVFTIPVSVTASTSIEDQSDADMRPFSLADLNAGDFVEIRGFEDPDNPGAVIATRVERDDPESEVELRGPATNVSQPVFTILGVTVTTNAQTRYENTTEAEFFANAEGRTVEAKGSWDGSSITAEEVEFED